MCVRVYAQRFIITTTLDPDRYLFVTRNIARPDSLSIFSMGTIEPSSLIYL